MNGDDKHPIEKTAGESYDEQAVTRLTRMESRISVVEVEVATIRSSFASKEDLHALQLALLGAIRQQGLDMRERTDAIVKRIHQLELMLQEQRTEFMGAIKQQRTELLDIIHRQREELIDLIKKQREESLELINRQRLDTQSLIASQRQEIVDAFNEQRADTLKYMASQAWRMYAFAAALLGAVYFIARNIH